MTKQKESVIENNIERDDIMEVTLSNGVKAVVKEPTTPQVRRCRDLAQTKPADVYFYMVCECTTFDGNIYSPDEVDELRGRDYLLVEGCIRELLAEKN